MIKKLVMMSAVIILSITVTAQSIEGFVFQQMETYPKFRLLDIYKSCFQDYMGAEHLVSDRQMVKAYLDEELNSTNLEDLMPWYYEPCGIEGNYVRVSLRTIKEGIILHSREYRDLYHPHYRIVERNIFEQEIKPLLDKKTE